MSINQEVYLNYWKGKYGEIIKKYEKEGRDNNGKWKDSRGIAVNSYKMVIEGYEELKEKKVKSILLKTGLNKEAKKIEKEIQEIIKRF